MRIISKLFSSEYFITNVCFYSFLKEIGYFYLCNVPSVKKKKKKRSDCWFSRAPHLSPLPITQSTPSFLSLAGHSHSCSPFLFLFQSTQHIHTLLSLTLPPVHSSLSPLPFFRQNHQKILKNITPSHKLFEVKVLISFDEYYVLI